MSRITSVSSIFILNIKFNCSNFILDYKICVFLAVATISILFAASTAEAEEKKSPENRFIEFLYTPNKSRKCWKIIK